FVGPIDDRIGNGFAYANTGDLSDDVVQAFDVLDIEGCVHVDAGVEQLLDVHVALGVPAAGGVRVGELIDQHQRRPALQDGVEIHLLEPVPLVLDPPARDDLDTFKQRLGLSAAVRLDDADDHVGPIAPFG